MSTYSLSLSASIVKSVYTRKASLTPTLSVPQNPSHQAIIPFSTLRSLSAAPFMQAYNMDASFITSAEEFFEDNPLIASTLQPATQTKYAVALETFKCSVVANELSNLSLDQRLAVYIQERFLADPRPGQRQEMANLVCTLLLMFPSMKHELGLARRCISGWKAPKPAQSSTPFTKTIMLALGWLMLKRKQKAAATALIISFSGCLRISEALKLTWKMVALPGDMRLAGYPAKTAGFNIADAKTMRYTGKLQFVKVSDGDGIKYLQALNRSPHRQADRLAKISYHDYSEALKVALKDAGLDQEKFTSHSARIGKATEDYIRGITVPQIAINGRWKSLNSLRYYVDNGRAWVLNTNISKENQNKIEDAASRMRSALYS